MQCLTLLMKIWWLHCLHDFGDFRRQFHLIQLAFIVICRIGWISNIHSWDIATALRFEQKFGFTTRPSTHRPTLETNRSPYMSRDGGDEINIGRFMSNGKNVNMPCTALEIRQNITRDILRPACQRSASKLGGGL